MLSKSFMRISAGLALVTTVAVITYFMAFYQGEEDSSISTTAIYKVPEKKKVFLDGEVERIGSETYQIDPSRGQISTIFVKDNEYVNKGQLILSYKNEGIIQQQAMLKGQLTTLEAAYEKINEMSSALDKGVGSTILAMNSSDVDFTSQLGSNLLQQESLKTQIIRLGEKAYSEVYAPFSGVISRDGSESSPIVTLEGKELQVACMVSEKDVLNLSKGQPVTLKIFSTGEELKGKITDLSTSVESKKSSNVQGLGLPIPAMEAVKSSDVNYYPVYIKLPKNAQVYPGFHVQVSTDSLREVPKVPKTAIFNINGKEYIWKVKSGVALKTQIKTLPLNNRYVKVVSGVEFGDSIIKVANNTIQEGDTIESEPNRD
ncbi:MAG: HlyD family efflux transporter periplasmic adaptor subunit [Clostridium sp.]